MRYSKFFPLPSFLAAVTIALAGCAAAPADDRQAIDTLILGDYVVTMSGQGVIRNGAVAVDDGSILAVGTASSLTASYRGEETISGDQKIVLPGLINGHTHAAMTLLRGIADDLPLMRWLQEYIFPAELQFVDADFVRTGTRLACWEMIRGGTTAFVDMYYFPDAVAETVEECGLRAIVVPGVIDQQAPDAANAEQSLAQAISFVERWTGRSERVTPAIGGHAIYTLPTERLVAVRDAATRLNAPVGIHLAETMDEDAFARANYQQSPVAYLQSIDFFRNLVIGAHVVHPDDADIATLAKQRVGAIHNPTSNMKLASGVAPVAEMIAAGVPVGLGTDGTASNNDLDMWEEIRLASLLAKVTRNDPEALPAITVLELATRRGAEAIGLGEITGSLKAGLRADLIQVSFDRASAQPLYDPLSHLVYVADQQDVVLTMVSGQILLRGRDVLTIDSDKLRDEVSAYEDAIRAAIRPD